MPLTDRSDSLSTRNLSVEGLLALVEETAIELRAVTSPPTPPAGAVLLFGKGDGKLYARDDGGIEHDLTAGAPVALRTVSRMLYLEYPQANDLLPLGFVAVDVTFTRVRAVVDAGTVSFNIQRRSVFTPNQPGPVMLAADLQADTDGATTTTFVDAGAVAADQWLYFVASGVTGSPTKLWIAFEYGVD